MDKSHHAAYRVTDRDFFDVRLALTLEEKLASRKQIKSVEAQRNDKRRSLFDAEDIIGHQRDDFIGKIEGKLQQRVGTAVLFKLRWNLTH